MPHNEWCVVSWEMHLGKRIDLRTTTEVTNNAEQLTTRETSHINYAGMTQEVAGKQTEDLNNAEPLSLDILNLTTEVRDNPFICRLSAIGSPPIPPKSPPTVVGYNPRRTAKYDLRPTPNPNANPDSRRLDALTSTQ